MKRSLKLLDKLAAEERAFLKQDFLAPRLPARDVTVRISGIICQMSITPPDFSGWGVFRPDNRKSAHFVRSASMVERETYLRLFPAVHVIVCGRDEHHWFGNQAFPSHRIHVKGRVPIQFPDDVQLFDTVTVRYDGTHFWYEGPYSGRSLTYAEYLRQSLVSLTEVADRPGILASEVQTYREVLTRRRAEIEEANRDKSEDKIRAALAHSGAVFLSYRERSDAFTVEYTINGRTHQSTVDKENLRVRSAGICLNGGDSEFDLTSLVEVIREGTERGSIVRVGDNTRHEDDDRDY